MSEHSIDMMLFLAKAIDPERLLAEIMPAVPGTLIFKNGDQGPDAWPIAPSCVRWSRS